MPEPSERDEPRDEPNLELPSLSLGFRRKKADQADQTTPEASPADDAPSEPPTANAPAKKAAKKAPKKTAAKKTAAKKAPAPPTAKTAPPPPAKKAAPPPPPARKAAPPPPPDTRPLPPPPPPAPELDDEPWDTGVEATPPQPLQPPHHPEPAAFPRETLEPARISGPLFVDEAEQDDDEPELDVPHESRMSSLRRHAAELPELTLPEVPGPVAAILTGIACGLVTVVLAWVAARGCEAVRGVGTCGGFGLFALIAILGIELLLGATLLRAWKVEDPTSTSFLGVGLVAVVAMLFFLDSIDSGWMVLVIPLLTAVTFLASWWVTATFVEESGD